MIHTNIFRDLDKETGKKLLKLNLALIRKKGNKAKLLHLYYRNYYKPTKLYWDEAIRIEF